MKQNTFEPCKDHYFQATTGSFENGHFNWCLFCEIEQLRKRCAVLQGRLDYVESGEKFSIEKIMKIENPDLSIHNIVNSWCK